MTLVIKLEHLIARWKALVAREAALRAQGVLLFKRKPKP